MLKCAIISDTHCGHRAGLTHPDFITPGLHTALRPLWDWFEGEFNDLGLLDLVIANGDLVEGPGKKDNRGILTTDTEEQADMCLKALSVVKTKRWRLTYGTPYHVSGSYDYENRVSEALDGKIREEQFLDLYGLKVSARHVVGSGSTPYTQPTLLYKEVTRDLIQANSAGAPRSDLIIRSHVHYSLVVEMEQTAVITPALKLPGKEAFGRKLRPWYYHVGYVYFEVSDTGKLETLKIRKIPVKLYNGRTYERF